MDFAPSLLITDDDRAFRETLSDGLRRRGCQTILAADGEEALDVVRRTEVHLVLIDMHMPRLTGTEAIHRIKQVRASLPCILISGRLDDEIRAAANAFRVLAKPITFQEIRDSVTEALQTTYNWTGSLG